MKDYDAVICDFFFNGKDEKIHKEYLSYVDKISQFFDQIKENAHWESSEADKILKDTLNILKTNTKNREKIQERIDFYKEKFSPKKEIYEMFLNSESYEFGYGGLIMLEAQKQNKCALTMSNMPSHLSCPYSNYDSIEHSVVKMIALSPLIENGIFSKDICSSIRYQTSERDDLNPMNGYKKSLAKIIAQYNKNDPIFKI